MQIVVTGGDGFIGRNLRLRLRESGYDNVTSTGRSNSSQELLSALATADFVFHLAGVNRPEHPAEFDTGNRALTVTVCEALRESGRKTPIAFTSSSQVLLDNPYGASKLAAEREVDRYSAETGAAAYRFRLTNVFGKWCRPNYNSVVATFCHNIARGLPISVNDPDSPLRLVYVDDVVDAMIGLLRNSSAGVCDVDVRPVYETTVGSIAALLHEFAASRETGVVPRTGTGLARALFATYASYLTPESFSYGLVKHADARGVFVEMVKTLDSGQVSFFTARPGVTRGGHYHHTKTEKFLVLSGRARFGFRHIVTGERHDIVVAGEECRVVETVPGWVHDVTNVGDDDLIVMLWANEIFDSRKPDTISAPVTA